MNQGTKPSTEARRLEEAARWSLRLSEDVSSTRDEAEFQAWLAADPRNRVTLDSLTATLQDVEQFAGVPEMVSLRGDALAAARRSHDVLRAKAFFSSRLGMVASIAALAVLLGVALFWMQFTSDAFETGIGERRVFALADGSQMFLDATTSVSVKYSTERRRHVLKRGRAKFDVARDPLRPFTVEAGGRVVVATGTSFSVELTASQVRVVLYEGHVEVLEPTGVKRIQPVNAQHRGKRADTALEPGHELVASTVATQAPMQINSIDAARSLAWQAGDLTFADEPLELAVERINRYSESRLKIGDAAAANVRISGVFHAGDTEAFIDGVTALFPVRVERADDGATFLFDERRGN